MNPLGQHVDTWTDQARSTVRVAPGSILKVLNTAIDRDMIQGYKWARPDGIVNYRYVYANEDLDPVGRVSTLMSSMVPIEDLVDVVETPWNESWQSGDDLKRYADATNQAVALIEGYGHDTSIGHFSQGNPPNIAGDWPNFYSALLPSKRKKWLSLHEYSAKAMQTGSGYHCLRWGSVYASLPSKYRTLPVIISEAGIDGGVLVPPVKMKGWRTFAASASDYASQLQWYGLNCLQIAQLYGIDVRVAVFCCGNFGDWQDFDYAGVPEIESTFRMSLKPF